MRHLPRAPRSLDAAMRGFVGLAYNCSGRFRFAARHIRGIRHNRGNVHDPTLRQGSAQDRGQLRRTRRGHAGVARSLDRREEDRAVLRWRHVSPSHQRVHDSRRRPARHGHRRARLQLRRRVSSLASSHPRGHALDGERGARTRMAASSSLRSGRPRTSTTGIRCSARSSKGSTSSRRSAGSPRAVRIVRSSPSS